MRLNLGFATALVMVAGVSASASGSALPDNSKERFSLFDPTPDRLLRDLTTDRPDTTESPFTVDAGRIQIETNLFGLSRSRADADGTATDTYDVAATNFRLGLTHRSEINVVARPFGVVRTKPNDPAEATRRSGVGGLDIRAKWNFWGNDAFETPGATALGLLPYVNLPTDRSNGVSPEHVEGGLIVPFAVKLSDKFGLGLNTGVHLARNASTAGYHPEYLNSASLSYEWSERLGTYYEVATRFGTRDPLGHIVMLGTGVTYKLNKNLQLDAGVNFGVTRASDRINPFVGLAARF